MLKRHGVLRRTSGIRILCASCKQPDDPAYCDEYVTHCDRCSAPTSGGLGGTLLPVPEGAASSLEQLLHERSPRLAETALAAIRGAAAELDD